MDMILNSLPSQTWNHLGINDVKASMDENLVNFVPDVHWDGTTAEWAPDCQKVLPWANMETAAGKDLQGLLANTSNNLIETREGAVMDSPILLKFCYQDQEKAATHLHLHAARNSTLSAVLFLTADPASTGVSAVQTEVYAEENSTVRLFVVQLLSNGFTCFNDIGGVCGDNASFELTKLELGSGRLYAGARVELEGAESSFTTDTGYYARSGQKLDMNYIANHIGKKSNSLMEFSGTLEDGAEKSFRGTIDFKRGCPGSKGTENENVLLLGDTMINKSIPLILCKEEDVEGNHGASIGRLDEKVLFYLSSRGIPAEEAQQMISRSRIESICNKIPVEEIRELVHNFEL